MALAPQFATHRFGSATARHTLELYLDLICPFSAKQLKGINEHVLPLLESNSALGESLSVVIRQVPQPWHAQGTYVHEAALAVSAVAPEKFKPFYASLQIEHQTEYFDDKVENETPAQIRQRLADLAATFGVDRAAFVEQITIGNGNSGTPVGVNLKLQVKYARQNGVHVTPTVALDGLIDGTVSSSFGKEDWVKFLNDKVLPKDSQI